MSYNGGGQNLQLAQSEISSDVDKSFSQIAISQSPLGHPPASLISSTNKFNGGSMQPSSTNDGTSSLKFGSQPYYPAGIINEVDSISSFSESSSFHGNLEK